jgi:hypothetical protein
MMAKFAFVLLALTTFVSARADTLSGLVMDGSFGVPLEGVSVVLQPSGLMTRSNADGHFSFRYDPKTMAAPIDRDLKDQTQVTKTAPSNTIAFAKQGYGSIAQNLKSPQGTANAVLTLEGKVTYLCTTADSKGRWQIARTIFDPTSKTSRITYLTDTSQWNFKPNVSPDGSKLTFFRRYFESGPCCDSWLSSICVMNADGSGLHEIIASEASFNTEPYWTRDGSNRVSFNRMNIPEAGPYWNEASGKPGAEQRMGQWGWVNPHLADGRAFMQRGGLSFLAKPSDDGKASYVQVQRQDDKFIHKIALSQDESIIAYQKWVDSKHDMYKGGVMVYAKFDASIPAITDEVIFDKLDPSTMAWYVSISTDNKFLLFAKDGAIMQYDVENGTTMKVSADADPYKAYPTYTTFSK